MIGGPDPKVDGLTGPGVEIQRIPGARNDLHPFHSGFQLVLSGVHEEREIFPVEEVAEFFAVEFDIDTANAPKGVVAEYVNESVL